MKKKKDNKKCDFLLSFQLQLTLLIMLHCAEYTLIFLKKVDMILFSMLFCYEDDWIKVNLCCIISEGEKIPWASMYLRNNPLMKTSWLYYPKDIHANIHTCTHSYWQTTTTTFLVVHTGCCGSCSNYAICLPVLLTMSNRNYFEFYLQSSFCDFF